MKPNRTAVFLAATGLCCAVALTESAAEIEASSGKVELAAGKLGSAAQFTGKGVALQYPSGLLHSNAGTLEMWVRPEQAASAIDLAPLASMGRPGADTPWFLVSLAKGKLGFLMQKGAKPFDKEGEFYASLSVDVADWKAGEWHHLAVAWVAGGPGQSVVKIYTDGALRDARFNLNLSTTPQSSDFGLGVNTASVQGPRFTGLMDEVRVSNTPRVDDEVRSAYEAGRTGKPLPADEATLLFLNFDQGTKGEQKATRALNEAELRAATRKVSP